MNTSCWLNRWLSCLALGLLGVSAQAQTSESATPSDDAQAHQAQLQQRATLRAQERAEIIAKRAEIEAQKQAAEKECWQKFAVESCLRTVRAQAREQDKPLREQELRLNSEERQEKSAERLRAIEQKQREKR
ncbi:MAG: hypothetical protein ACI4QS_04955, partial [Comamonas sp.]